MREKEVKGDNYIEKIVREYNVLTIVQLCDLLGVSKKYAYQFIREHNIKHIKIGKKFYISKKAVDKVLEMDS